MNIIFDRQRKSRPAYLSMAGSFAVLAFASFAGTASAQDADEGTDENARRLDTITVTSQLREQSLQDVPTSVQAFSDEQFENFGVGSTDTLVTLTPSIAVNKFLTPYQSSIRIRGVGTNVSSPLVESAVSMVVDGVVISRQAAFFTELSDIERVEVLRGPQSTLYGKNATAGVISIVTKKPSMDEFTGSVEATYNDYGDLTLRGTMSGPITENLAGSLTGVYYDEGDGIITNTFEGGPSLDNAQSQGFRGKLYWEPSSNLDFTLIADYRQADGPNTTRVPVAFESQAVQDLYGLGPVDESNRSVRINGGPFGQHGYDTDETGISLQANYQIGDMQLTSITAYRDYNVTNSADVDQIGTLFAPNPYDDPLLVPGVGPADTGRITLIGSSQVYGDIESSQFSQEVRLTSSDSGPFRWLVGAYYWDTAIEFDNNQVVGICPINIFAPGAQFIPPSTFIPAFDGDPNALTGTCGIPLNLAFNTVYDVNTQYTALFGNVDFDLTDKLTATIGARIQEDEFEYTQTGGNVANILATVPGTIATVVPFDDTNTVTNTVVTGKASLAYAVSDYTNLYGSYSRGYKGPGLDAPASKRSFDELPLDEETVDAYEIGLKTSLFDGTATLNIAAFWQQYEDLQQSAYDTENAVLTATNAGTSIQKGVEIDALYRATDNLTLSAAIVYLDATYDEFTNADCFTPRALDENCVYVASPTSPLAAGIKDVSGEPVPYSPEWAFNLSADYVQPLGKFNAILHADYRYLDDQIGLSSQNPDSILDAYGITNLRIGVETADGKYSVTGFVNNVFDEHYATLILPFTYSGVAGALNNNTVTQSISKGADRYFGLTLRAKW